MLSEISLNCSSQPSCKLLIAAIWKSNTERRSAQFLGSQEQMLPIRPKTIEHHSVRFFRLPADDRSRKTRIRLAVFFSLFSCLAGKRSASPFSPTRAFMAPIWRRPVPAFHAPRRAGCPRKSGCSGYRSAYSARVQ